MLLQGGSTAGETSLTAFVLVSLLEARVIEGVSILSQHFFYSNELSFITLCILDSP